MRSFILPGLILLLTAIMNLGCKKDVHTLESVTIYRDTFGVPHIHAPSDEEVAYGLAWASCEDDFLTVQEQMLAIKGKYGQVRGREGVVADFGIKFMGIHEYARKNTYHMLSDKMLKILRHYADGVNTYAALHPGEVLLRSAFPIEPHDLVAGYLLGLVEISGAGADLQKIMNGQIIKDLKSNFPRGSNGIAISRRRSTENMTYLAINSHQPMEGWYSWYEAHLMSDEGMNILGGTFPGGLTIFHGTNEFLGWAHTVNYADFSDVFKLDMHPNKKLHYSVDGSWYKLKVQPLWAWMKVWGPLKIPIRRKMYKSIYGPAFKTDHGFFAWNFAARTSVKAVEQWYRMNRARNFSDFKEALETLAIPCTNIVYADRDDNIFYISNGRFPKRNPKWEWREVVPGDTSATIPSFAPVPLDSLPMVLNPSSGYVFNTNHTPFLATAEGENPEKKASFDVMGYEDVEWQNNRSARFQELISHYDRLSYDDFKTLKYDRRYPSKLRQYSMQNQELLLNLEPDEFPHIENSICQLNYWDRMTSPGNLTAALFEIALGQLRSLHYNESPGDQRTVDKHLCARAVEKATEIMNKSFQTTEIPLSDVVRHARGKVSIGLGGGSDVLAAIQSRPWKNGTYKAVSGESYIQLVRFTADGSPMIESVNAYGSSAEPSSPHYTDQMELFVNQELRPMHLALDKVQASAVSVYHPLTLK
jgi:acyl-homoserine-lactone acylase